MASIDPESSRTAEWIRKHPKLATVGVVLFIVGLGALIAIDQAPKVTNPSSGGVSKAYILKSIALVAGALFIAWRANRAMSKH